MDKKERFEKETRQVVEEGFEVFAKDNQAEAQKEEQKSSRKK